MTIYKLYSFGPDEKHDKKQKTLMKKIQAEVKKSKMKLVGMEEITSPETECLITVLKYA